MKIIALTLCLFIFLSFSACGGDSESGFTGVDHSSSPKDSAGTKNAEIQGGQNENQNGNQNSAGLTGNLSGKSSEMTAGFVKAMSAIDSGKAVKTDWPASDFPAGYPVYPDGEVVYTENFFDKDLLIFITKTGRAAYDSYIGTLRTDGWIFVDIDDEDGGNSR